MNFLLWLTHYLNFIYGNLLRQKTLPNLGNLIWGAFIKKIVDH